MDQDSKGNYIGTPPIDETQYQVPLEEVWSDRTREVDRYDRKIIESKCHVDLKDNQIIFHGYIKKWDQYKNSEIFDFFPPNDVPKGWVRRKEHQYFYTANDYNICNILDYRARRNRDCKFTPAFCIYLKEELDEEKKTNKALAIVKTLDLTEQNKKTIEAMPDPYEKPFKDFLHQKIASQWAWHLSSVGLLEEQGLGKTKTAIETYMAKKGILDTDDLNKTDLVDRCLVIAPLSVLGEMGWIKQIKQWGAGRATYILLRGNQTEKLAILNGVYGDFDFYLTNYEGLLNIEEEILEWVDDRTYVIVDETSKIKNFAAKRTKIVIKIGQRTNYKMCLTGTPITQGAQDVFSQWLFLDKGSTFGSSQDRFLERYFNKIGWKWHPRGGKNGWALKEISELMFNRAVRFTKDQALDLPPKTYQLRGATMTPLQTEWYNKILQQEIIKLENMERVTAQNILVMILRMQQITSGFISPQDQEGNPTGIKNIDNVNPKLHALEEIMDELGEAPVVIWSRFKYDVEMICGLLKRKDITYVKYVGGMNELQRSEAERMFVEGEAQCFVSIPAAGGMGMNLQRASYAIYYSNDYSLQNRLQSEDRVHRIGQVNKVTIIDILAVTHGGGYTIDMTVKAALSEKKSVADIVTRDQLTAFLTARNVNMDNGMIKEVKQIEN